MPPPICPAPRTPIVRISMSLLRARVAWQDYHVPRALGSIAAALTLAAALSVGCASQGPVARAQQLVRLRRDAEAKQTLEAHLAKHPDDVPARRMLVRVLAWTGDLEGA